MLKLFPRKITNKEAISLGLTWYSNLHGDVINSLNCRSIWMDQDGRTYTGKQLYKEKAY